MGGGERKGGERGRQRNYERGGMKEKGRRKKRKVDSKVHDRVVQLTSNKFPPLSLLKWKMSTPSFMPVFPKVKRPGRF